MNSPRASTRPASRAAPGPALARLMTRTFVLLHYAPSAIRRAVINDDDLDGPVSLRQHAGDRLAQEGGAVVHRDDGGDQSFEQRVTFHVPA